MKFALVLLLVVPHAWSEVLRAYSEFTRFDPLGNIIRVDRGAEPRHILSPGFARNGYASLRIVVRLDKPASFSLEIGQNPVNAVKPQLYKEIYEEHNGEWIPDRLLPVGLPYKGRIPDPAVNVSGQTTATFWLDMWIDAKAEVDRIKIEPQLYVYDDWYTWPMEVRIMEPVYPKVSTSSVDLPPATARSDSTAIAALRQEFCGDKPKAAESVLTTRQLIRRNALQHTALGRVRNEQATRDALVRSSGAASVEAWCQSKQPPSTGPEWYLRFRDQIFNSRPAPRLRRSP